MRAPALSRGCELMHKSINNITGAQAFHNASFPQNGYPGAYPSAPVGSHASLWKGQSMHCGKVDSKKTLNGAWLDFLTLLESQYGQFEWFGHFTFKEPLHPEQANKRWLRFVRQINRKLYGRRFGDHRQGVTWVRGQENQKRDAIHYHGFFGNGVKKLRRLDFVDIWQDVCEGYCRIWSYDGRMNAKEYVTKYVIKEGEIDVHIPSILTARLI